MMHPALALAALVAATTPVAPINPPHTFTPAMARAVVQLAERDVRAHNAVGIGIGIVEDGRVVYAQGFGYANLAKHIAFTPSTQTYIGAASAQFTAAAVLLLQQDGKLKLDDKVTKYIPELTLAKDVTIAQLLQQTSGFPHIAKLAGLNQDRSRVVKLNDIIAAMNKQQLISVPGTAYEDNSLNYMIAGLVVERASGVPLSDYLQQHIFLPLVMNSTFYAGDTGISPRAAVGYTGSPKSVLPAHPYDASWLFGAAGIVTTVYDLAKWDIEMPVLLRDDAVRDMYTPSGAKGDIRYGMGYVIDERDGKRFMWDNGQIPGYHAMNAVLPDDHIAVIVLTNVDMRASGNMVQPEALASRILDIVAPPSVAHLDNAIVTRAREWLERLANNRIDRTQLTASFSSYLTDDLVVRSNFAQYGKILALIPVSSIDRGNGDTMYEFLVRYPKDTFHFRFTVAKDGKVDGLQLVP
ncbi:MAG TPA: serine hydrolase domain-containing protein [Candidatus Dormibacteraeota bacterium]|nr:serine hydrolase domain-containing protein [Candidatus Dormibacteraeota bacterium]